jgi:hypothetical protein
VRVSWSFAGEGDVMPAMMRGCFDDEARRCGTPLFTMPRATVLQSLVLNHVIHHRAILCVYLRLNDIPAPGMYGPSGDEFSGW